MRHRSPFAIDYANLQDVIRYANDLARSGYAMCIIKMPGRANYNIMHAVNADRKIRNGVDMTVVHRTA